MNKKGITLIEIVIAITIFAMAVLPVAGLFSRSTFFTKKNQDYQTAWQFAFTTLQGLRNLPARDIPTLKPVPLDQTFGRGKNAIFIPSTLRANASDFSCRLNVTYVTQQLGRNTLKLSSLADNRNNTVTVSIYKQLRRMDLRVQWKDRLTHKIEQIELTCYKADLQ